MEVMGFGLVSGGPPCQSFSMAGLRQFNNTNTLPWEFAKFVQTTQPKIALLENVTGILRAFDVDGKKFYAWFEVAKAFAQINYIPYVYISMPSMRCCPKPPTFYIYRGSA
jgi:DNA (cytosine-5)-methyltransferase 1